MKAHVNTAAVFFTLILFLNACDMVERKDAIGTEATSNSNFSDQVTKSNNCNKELDNDTVFADTSLVSLIQDTNVNVKEISNEFNFTDHLKTKSGITIDWIKNQMRANQRRRITHARNTD